MAINTINSTLPVRQMALMSTDTNQGNTSSPSTNISSSIALIKAINSGQVKSLTINKDSKGSISFYTIEIENNSGDFQKVTILSDNELDAVNNAAQTKNLPVTEQIETHHTRNFFAGLGNFFKDILKYSLSVLAILAIPVLAGAFAFKKINTKMGLTSEHFAGLKQAFKNM